MAGGRPKKYDPIDIAKRLDNYIKEEDNPILPGFCIQQGNPCKDTLYELAKNCTELSDSIKRAVDKQEAFYEKGAANGEVNPTFAIFKLKQPQHGWTDKQQIDTNVNAVVNDVTNLTPEQRKERIAELLEKYQK
jgi:hypothetical protein